MTTRNLNRNLQSKTSNKFYTKFLGLDHNSTNILGRQIISVERPSVNFTAIEHRNKESITKHTTVAELEPITMEFRDDISGNTIRSLYDIIFAQAAKTQEAFEIKVDIQDHNGIIIEGYTLKECFIQNISQNQLNYTSSENSIITITVYYHNIDYTSTFEYDDKSIFDSAGRFAHIHTPSIFDADAYGSVNIVIAMTVPSVPTGEAFGTGMYVIGTIIPDSMLSGESLSTDLEVSFPYPMGFNPEGGWAATNNAKMGWSVDIDNGRVIIGEPQANYSNYKRGYAHIFNTDGSFVMTLAASSSAQDDQFGYAVAMDGNVIVVGSPQRSSWSGAIDIFEADGTFVDKIYSPTPAGYTHFGESIATDGNYIVVGQYDATVSGVTGAGSAHIFNTDGTLVTTINAPALDEYARFGFSVAIDGNYIIVGAAQEDNARSGQHGAAYIFNTAGTYIGECLIPPEHDDIYTDMFGGSVDVDVASGLIAVGAPQQDEPTGGADQGNVYMYNLAGVYQDFIQNPSSGSHFGNSVSINNGRIAIGERYYGWLTGRAHIYNTVFTFIETIYSPNSAGLNYFGTSVATDGNYTIAGSPGEDDPINGCGKAYIFDTQ